MIKLKLIEKNNFEYNFEDENKNVYLMNLEFIDADMPELVVGDFLCLNENLLNPKFHGYSDSYTFGSLESEYGRSELSIDDIDVVKIVRSLDNSEVYLKRLYG